MITENNVTEFFCIADDFCKVFFDAQMSNIRLRHAFFLKYIRQTDVFFRYPRTTFQSFISSARYSNQ